MGSALGTIDCFSFPPAMAGGAKKKRVARVSKKKKNGRGRDVGADLTDDVLVDILSCVPIKSLYRCKSVVATYSSNTGIWSLKEEHFNWNGDGGFGMHMAMGSKGVFFNGVLHLASCHGLVLAIDVEGNILRGIPAPMPPDYDNYIREKFGDVYLSQGHLYFAARRVADGSNDYGLSVWVLEDYNSENWSLKHNVNILDLFGAHYYSVFRDNFKVISIHPERNVIFMVCGTDRTLMCYEMDHRRLRFVSRLGSHCSTPYIPYVPLFSGSMADGH
ncbi:hypothetical protein HU200_042683 [Digitaria exilis]|uniref:F-box protein At3g26010-like beta-propeller domain-containing protein n=1 Tax=Digitaria exilis TaxID=1010633 RepID=A0A835EFP3_9POAL|nr:hypothetical protein HU200_042683 [Digitaria exilis]